MTLVYLDTSVALAHLLGEDVSPPEEIWGEGLISSRVLTYEVWTRLDAMGLRATHGDFASELLSRVSMVEMVGPVLSRASTGLRGPVRTLDALHLASVLFAIEQGASVALASYDQRLCAAAGAHGIDLYPL